MTETKLTREFWADPSPNRDGWIARFQALGIGVRTVVIEGVVTKENSKPVAEIFPTKVEAELAAARAKDRAEDRGRQPLPRSAKVFGSTGQGRNRRARAI
ncbi:hypothetical protein [Bosea rubneri]|uniref:Uncharacterized protein n=1 Tax=Bosea rubneri TaxID=3075434 RepID=A0ABU3SFS3_9HYPH|nr:hypothetical protein [Bosea sp. ZW T0_25]MDU0343640.1 hypothetical protein [Bosea sp. ZW T0_25]